MHMVPLKSMADLICPGLGSSPIVGNDHFECCSQMAKTFLDCLEEWQREVGRAERYLCWPSRLPYFNFCSAGAPLAGASCIVGSSWLRSRLHVTMDKFLIIWTCSPPQKHGSNLSHLALFVWSYWSL